VSDLRCADCGLEGAGVTVATWARPPRPLCGNHWSEARAGLHSAGKPERVDGRKCASGGQFVLDVPEQVPAIWGEGDDVLQAAGEPLFICAPPGVGKTTLAGQLALARLGVLAPTLLGLPVEPDSRPVLYIAADRPAQIARSMRRQVGEQHREQLDNGLKVWRGPLPFNVTDDPARLAEWVTGLRVGTIILDSLKDIAIGLAEDAIGAAVNQALQHVVACEIEVVALHHQRKGQDGRKPRRLEDVYGSTWLTAGAGSVVLLWGEAGDPYVELTHLKQPAGEVGPFTIHHDHTRGRSTLPEAVDLLDLAAGGVTAIEAAQAIYDASAPTKNQKERARRRLEKLADDGRVTRREPLERNGQVTYWLPVVAHANVTPRGPLRGPSTQGSTEVHDLALGAGTHPSTQGHAQLGPHFKGAVTPSVDPLEPRQATAEEEARIARLEAA